MGLQVNQLYKIKPVIMAGGFGTRLWPLSTQKNPKQFLRLFDKLSLLQQTLIRNYKFGTPCVVVNKIHQKLALSQVNEIDLDVDLLIEDSPRNTAATAIVAALKYKIEGDRFLLLIPCDHRIEDIENYTRDIQTAVKYLDVYNLVMIGSNALKPDTNYGYIKISKKIAENIYTIESFKEKPDLKLATDYVNNGNYFWNSGIYIINIDFLLTKAKLLDPLLYLQILRSFLSTNKLSSQIMTISYSHEIKAISIDTAIINHVTEALLVESSSKWEDLGNYKNINELALRISLESSEHNKKIQKSWGYYEVISNSYTSKTKKLVLKPCNKTSLQYHNHRAEYWVITHGTAEVIIGSTKQIAYEGDYFYVPIRSTHQIRNVSHIENLELIEIQIGDCLSENDIVRFNE